LIFNLVLIDLINSSLVSSGLWLWNAKRGKIVSFDKSLSFKYIYENIAAQISANAKDSFVNGEPCISSCAVIVHRQKLLVRKLKIVHILFFQ
jgi:hypothetical protein